MRSSNCKIYLGLTLLILSSQIFRSDVWDSRNLKMLLCLPEFCYGIATCTSYCFCRQAAFFLDPCGILTFNAQCGQYTIFSASSGIRVCEEVRWIAGGLWCWHCQSWCGCRTGRGLRASFRPHSQRSWRPTMKCCRCPARPRTRRPMARPTAQQTAPPRTSATPKASAPTSCCRWCACHPLIQSASSVGTLWGPTCATRVARCSFALHVLEF